MPSELHTHARAYRCCGQKQFQETRRESGLKIRKQDKSVVSIDFCTYWLPSQIQMLQDLILFNYVLLVPAPCFDDSH